MPRRTSKSNAIVELPDDEIVVAQLEPTENSAPSEANAANRKRARQWIAGSAATAAAVAAIPLPIASATILAPIQFRMFGKISSIYGLSLRSMLGFRGLFQLALQLTGRAAAQSLVKLIPGAGSVINSTVASAWTYAAGEAWIRLCEKVAAGQLEPEIIDGRIVGYLRPQIELDVKRRLTGLRKG